MRFEIILTDSALEDFKALPAPVKASIRDALETHLRFEPKKISKSRIKRLRDLKQPEYRLRVDERIRGRVLVKSWEPGNYATDVASESAF